VKLNPLQFDTSNSTENYGEVHAYSGEEHVGQMRWATRTSKYSKRPGEIVEMYVHPEARRQGVGTAMWNHASENFEQGPAHSPARTPLGNQFAQSIGTPVPWKKKLPPVD
jgi:GNAT superfamily N-acetyltransferase